MDIQKYIKELSNDPVIVDTFKKITIQAYPNYDQYFYIPGQRDTNKWLQAVKEVYYKERDGIQRRDALNKVTHNWDVMEVYDFLNWLRYYEEGAHLKYKVAQQFYYGNADVGYLLPIKQDPPESTSVSGKDIDFARDSAADELPIREKKRIIEKQRQKIVGRLDSAEKLLRSEEGQIFADRELESLLAAIYDLKKKVQMLNKKSTSTKLYDDLIIRQANILNKKGFMKAANLLYSLAEDQKSEVKDPNKPEAKDPNKPEVQEQNKPITTPSPDPPTRVSGAPGSLPTTGPGSPQTSPPNNSPSIKTNVPVQPNQPIQNKDPGKAISEFMKGLKTSLKTVEDNNDNLEVFDEDLVIEAQAEPPSQVPVTPPPPIKEPEIEVEEPKKIIEDTPKTTTKDVDKMIDAVFSNLTIADVVAKFEDIAKFYKTREMPRQLAFADMMLDSLGLAPFFPTLAEATNKSLEANNYILSRVEDILTKLRGTLKTKEFDVMNETTKQVSPEIEKTKQVLQEEANKDKERKQMRKDLEEQSMKEQMKETPEIEVEEDLEAKPSPAPAPKPPVPTV